MNEHGDILPYTPMKNVQLKMVHKHLMDESEDESQNPLSEDNWMKQNNCKSIKYVIHQRHPMAPEQLKQKPFEEIFKNQHEKVDTDEEESTKVQEEFTTSEEIHKKNYISILYTSNFINSSTTYISKSLYTKKKKNLYMISFYTNETSCMKWKTNTA